MDTRLRKRMQEIRSMTNEQLNEYRQNIIEKGFSEGLRTASQAFIQAMQEEPKIYGPAIERVKEKAVLLVNSGAVDMGDNSND